MREESLQMFICVTHPEDDKPAPPSSLLHLRLSLGQPTISSKVKRMISEWGRMHAPMSVVNGEDCTFPADTLPNFGGMIVQ